MNKEKIDALLIEAQAAVGTVMDQPTVAWKIKQARLELYAPDDPPTPKRFVPPLDMIEDDGNIIKITGSDCDALIGHDGNIRTIRRLAHAAKVGKKAIGLLRYIENQHKEGSPAKVGTKRQDIIDEWDKGTQI